MPLSDHLRKIIPGAICAAIGGILLLFGGLIYFVEYMTSQEMLTYCAMYAVYGMDYMDFCLPNSGMLSFAVGLVVFGCIFLVIGIGFLAKGVSIYRHPSIRRYSRMAEEARFDANELENEGEDLEEPITSVRARSSSQCPRCGEILLDTMETCPSCKRPVETRLAAPAALPATAPSTTAEKTPAGGISKNYCMFCGNRMPDVPDLAYCPICGKQIG